VCAPTGAGKTNIAMITVLREVAAHMAHGVIQKDAFKVGGVGGGVRESGCVQQQPLQYSCTVLGAVLCWGHTEGGVQGMRFWWWGVSVGVNGIKLGGRTQQPGLFAVNKGASLHSTWVVSCIV
jgi:hypothetical protein